MKQPLEMKEWYSEKVLGSMPFAKRLTYKLVSFLNKHESQISAILFFIVIIGIIFVTWWSAF